MNPETDLKPLVSIVIPCWNAAEFAGEAIESALAQTYENIEVIVIDDGSTDSTLDVIRSFEDRVRWETGANRGGSAARNRGLQLAKGTLIQFLDADDLLLPEKLERMVPQALATGPSMSVVCDWQERGMSETTFRRHSLGAAVAEDPIQYLLFNRLQTSSPVHWKERLESVGGFDPDFSCCQEMDLHLRLAVSGLRFAYLPEALFTVRTRTGSVSSDYRKLLRQRAPMLVRIFEQLSAAGALTPTHADSIAEKLAQSGRQCLWQGDVMLGRRYFRLAQQISKAGMLRVYRRLSARSAVRLIGPLATERLISFARRQHSRIASQAEAPGR